MYLIRYIEHLSLDSSDCLFALWFSSYILSFGIILLSVEMEVEMSMMKEWVELQNWIYWLHFVVSGSLFFYGFTEEWKCYQRFCASLQLPLSCYYAGYYFGLANGQWWYHKCWKLTLSTLQILDFGAGEPHFLWECLDFQWEFWLLWVHIVGKYLKLNNLEHGVLLWIIKVPNFITLIGPITL